jgi:hypothetical protein
VPPDSKPRATRLAIDTALRSRAKPPSVSKDHRNSKATAKISRYQTKQHTLGDSEDYTVSGCGTC